MSNKVKNVEFPQTENPNRIEAGIGYIDWDSDNLQLIAIMEAVEDRLKTSSPLALENLIKYGR